MHSEIKTIVQEFFKTQKLDQITITEGKIIKELGQKFLDKMIKQIYIQNNAIIIQTNTIEAKTELTLIKQKITTQKTQVIIK
tara:strand:+ start:69 stop:314 length:246 start_codon:yes stop_codon:yes gene_type:complete